MFGIQVSLYFINSLLTITIFQTLLLLLLQRKWKGEEHVTIIFTVFSVLLSVLLVRYLVAWGYIGGRLTWRTVDQADSCSVLRHLLAQVFLLFRSCPVPYRTGLFVTRANLRHSVFDCSVLRHVSRPGRSALLIQCLIIRGYCRAVPSERLEELLIRQILVPSYGIFSLELLTSRKTAR
jgi:hypothetical protein